MCSGRKIDGISDSLARVQNVLKSDHQIRAYLALVALSFLAGCQTTSTAPKERSIGDAFAGPANLELRKEIAPKSGTVATVHFGEKLEVLQVKRHFVKVRSAKGAEGWVDEPQLLDNAAMDQLRKLSTDTLKFSSQGKATTYDLLNVHTEPSRTSPSYLQIQAAERVDVIGHKTAPRISPPRKRPAIVRPKAPRPTKPKKKEKSSRVPPPPVPKAPEPPPDWVTLSKERTPPVDPDPKPEAPTSPPEDWTLIRNKGGQSGWVLTQKIYMAIPDDVAQYAEGKRITSYFSLGRIQDEAGPKDIWLWTTIGSGVQPYDYDSYRVFIWNPRRHRYETSYIQRRVEGFFPVRASEGKFSVVIEKDDGKRYRQNFDMIGNRVHLAGEEPET